MLFDIFEFLIHARKRDFANYEKSINAYSTLTDTINLVASLFEYGGNYPDTLNMKYAEYYALSEGYAGIGLNDGNLITTRGSLSGNLDAYNIGTHFEGTTPVGSIAGTRGVDVVVLRNNDMYLPDLDLYQYSELLTEVITSLKVGIINTRATQILLSDDDTIISELKMMIKEALSGFPKIIHSSKMDFTRALSSAGIKSNKLDSIYLNDIKDSDKLKYLSAVYEDIQRIYLRKYGIHLTNVSKMAQVNESEANDGQGLSLIIIKDMLKCRQEAVDQINKIFGCSMTVRLNPVIEQNEKEYFTESEVDNNDTNEPNEAELHTDGTLDTDAE